MVSEGKAIEVINRYLKGANELNACRHFPVTLSQIYEDHQLCEDIMDYLGDIYVLTGLDMNNEETESGSEIMDAISFLAFCNGN